MRAINTGRPWVEGDTMLDRALNFEPHVGVLDAAIDRAREGLLSLQHPDGYWSFELEADATIPAEYILMMHYMDEVDAALQAKLASYLRARQADHGGWPLYPGGDFEVSCSVKAYYALKLAGDHPEDAHMAWAREAILAHGGAARSNVFTRITLALFAQIPWRGTPFVPVELVLLPRWSPFEIGKVSYWSRTVVVPLSILCSLKPRARNPRGIGIGELFTVQPEEERNYFPVRSRLNRVFLLLERMARLFEPLIPGWLRRRAIKRAEQWIVERLNGHGGLGAIFPAIVNAYEALDCLGYAPDHPHRVQTRRALDDLLVIRETDAYCQPCVSPVWDTTLAGLALEPLEDLEARTATIRALDWLRERQLLEEPGDWRDYRPDLPGGGWPFQFDNGHYPDLDDTSAVAWAMDTLDPERYDFAVRRAADWICGMQSQNGGFASFDADNCHYSLNEIPFADHGALLDPPTADVTGRCVALLARRQSDDPRYARALEAALDYLRREQESAGCWFGRWGTNYIYGTWSVLSALEQIGVPPADPAVQRAVAWLKATQQADGGWGESNDSYADPALAGRGQESTSYQTAWALLALMAAGEVESPAVQRGIEFLLRRQQECGLWEDAWFTAPGFPRVFYLKYHGYCKYFPLWALARYRQLSS